MRIRIENGKLAIPADLLRAMSLPPEGECEAVVEGRTLTLTPTGQRDLEPPYPVPEEMLRLLRGPLVPADTDVMPDPADEAD